MPTNVQITETGYADYKRRLISDGAGTTAILVEQDMEPTSYQFRYYIEIGRPHWGPWYPLEASMLASIRGYIEVGYKYQIRTIHATVEDYLA